MHQPITFGYVDSHPTDLKRIQAVYRSGQFSPGLMCRDFEERFRVYHGRKHAYFVNSGTDALRLGLLAMKEKHRWSDGSSVVVPAVTFVASLNAIIQAGLKPLVVDVGMYDYNLNPHKLNHILGTNVTNEGIVAIMPVHLFGQICDMKMIMEIAKRYKLRVIEDSCESVGSEQYGKKCGTFGDIACFSTYQCHILATGVGGMAVTNDWQLNDLMHSYGNHGRDTAYLPGFRKPAISRSLLSKRFRFLRSGYSCRPSEFEAALGIGQMERLDENLRKRRIVAGKLIRALEEQYVLSWPFAEVGRTHSYMMFPIVVKENSLIQKKDLCWFLEKHGIETRDMMPITTQPIYASLNLQGHSVAEWINKNGFYIPCHPGMTDRDINYIQRVFLDFLKK